MNWDDVLWIGGLEMEGIKGLDNNECVHLQGDVEMEIKCRKMCVWVCVSCYPTVLLTTGHNHG